MLTGRYLRLGAPHRQHSSEKQAWHVSTRVTPRVNGTYNLFAETVTDDRFG